MGKKIAVFLAVCLIAGGVTARAANRVPEMKIDAALRPDGSARITQTWTADTSEGTEFYLSCRDSGYLEVTDFAVSDVDGTYTLLENWDVDASFSEKAGKCGICETEDGVELCWGISKYGNRRYTISYVLHGLVGAYSDGDGFNHCFIDEMDVFPTDVTLTIRREDGGPLDDGNCGIWAFGFDGQIQFDNGVIRAWSESALESGQHMTVMVSLDKGVLSPLRRGDGSFEDVKERAFAGSDYEEDGGSLLLGLAAMAGVGAVIALGVKIAGAFRKAGLRRRMKRTDYFRDAPNNGNLNVTYCLGVCVGLCREDALLGAWLLRLLGGGALEPEENGSSPVNLRLVRPPRNGTAFDDAFYTILEAAAGTDGVLQAKELERFCEQNGKPLAGFVNSCCLDAEWTLTQGGCFKGDVVRKGARHLTRQGQQQLDEILGLKRFLLDFSLIHERGVRETVVWQDYLIYAQLLGIARETAPQIRKLYPDALPQVEQFERYISYAGYYSGVFYNAYEREQRRQEAARSGGSGGSASFGGGGGSSGGGGGGTR